MFIMKKIKLTEIYEKNKIVKTIVVIIFNILLLPFAIILFLLRIFFHLHFVRLYDSRVGHLIMNTDLFLRRIKSGYFKHSKKARYVGLALKSPANQTILDLFSREFRIVQLPNIISNNYLYRFASTYDSILNKLGLFHKLPLTCADPEPGKPLTSEEYKEFSMPIINVRFNEAEEERGKALLRDMGVGNNWFVCVFARDLAFVQGLGIIKEKDYRNFDITDMAKAMRYITDNGGYAVRMGSVVKKSLNDLNIKNRKIIDYSVKYRTDFGDAYLPAKCKFFLGCGSGINNVPIIFGVPVIWINVIPIAFVPYGKNDLFIPKKIWSVKEGRFLTFREIIKRGIIYLRETDYNINDMYKKEGLEVVNNSPSEILDVTQELNDSLDDKWKPEEEDEALQERFKALFDESTPCHGFQSRIGAKFLRENKHLLE